MKASESIGKNLKIFGSAVPVGDYHFSTKGSKYRAPGEAPQYWGILKAVYKPREAFKGFNSPWVYFLATFDPNDIAETAINRQVPYRNLEKAVAAYWDVHDRYYPEVKDIEFGCRDWSEVCENAKKSTFTLSESQLHNLIAESVKKVLKEMETPTPYGPMTSGEWKPTFDDPNQQGQLASDTVDMLSKIPDERFVKLYWDRRMTFKDPDTVDAIYKEAIKRGIL